MRKVNKKKIKKSTIYKQNKMKCVMQKYLSIYYLFDLIRVGSQNGSRNTNSLHTYNSDSTVTIDAPTSTVTWIRFGYLRLQLQCNMNRRNLSWIKYYRILSLELFKKPRPIQIWNQWPGGDVWLPSDVLTR